MLKEEVVERKEMQRKKTSSLKKEIYDSILKEVVEGIYKPGDIINEKNLIEKYGVSKSPIRDALIELCNEGVLVCHPRYGYDVVRIDEKEIKDIVEFRVMVEVSCLKRAAMVMTKEDIEELRSFTINECSGDDPNTTLLNHWYNNGKFHLKLLSYSRNKYCYNLVEKSIGVLTRAYVQRNWEKWGVQSIKMGCENHLEIIDYLSENDAEKAAQELERDISSFLNIILSVY